MREIAILKACADQEKNRILSAAAENDMFYFFDSEQALLQDPASQHIQILLGEPDMDTISQLPQLRWIQMTWAGANKYTSLPDFPKTITLTSASGAFGPVISEHILSGILALYKNLPRYRTQLQNGLWQRLDTDTTLEGKTALILGTGDIGSETAKKLRIFGAKTIGICRTAKADLPHFDQCHTLQALDRLLPEADLVIIALPGTTQTSGLFSKDRIRLMRPDAVLANVGRGFIVDTQALTDALAGGKLRGAVLDVTDPEPLPPDHPLRFMEQVILTPHTAGVSWSSNVFTKNRILDIFCENLRNDHSNLPLCNVIDFTQGY